MIEKMLFLGCFLALLILKRHLNAFSTDFLIVLLCYFTMSCLRLPSKRMRRWAGYYIM